MISKFGPLILILALCSAAPAQTTKRRGVVRKPTVTTPQPQPVAQPTPASKPVRPPAAPAPLVTINGQIITTADLEPALRQELETLVKRVEHCRLETHPHFFDFFVDGCQFRPADSGSRVSG